MNNVDKCEACPTFEHCRWDSTDVIPTSVSALSAVTRTLSNIKTDIVCLRTCVEKVDERMTELVHQVSTIFDMLGVQRGSIEAIGEVLAEQTCIVRVVEEKVDELVARKDQHDEEDHSPQQAGRSEDVEMGAGGLVVD